MTSLAANAPGVLLAVAVMLAGFELADVLGRALLSARGLSGASPVSGVPVAIVLGLLVRNLVRLPKALGPGLKFCTTTVLRLGIVLVGIKLSVLEMARLGLAGIPATAGFVGKFYLIDASVDGDFTWLGIVIVIGSMISLGYYLRVIAAMWMRRERSVATTEGDGSG